MTEKRNEWKISVSPLLALGFFLALRWALDGRLRRRSRLACLIETAQPAAVLAFAAAVRETGRALLSLFQPKPTGAVAVPAIAGSFAVRAFAICLCH
jgi:hypothetical protein